MRYFIIVVLFGGLFNFSFAQSLPKIIFDTDMGPDYDDIGALAMLHNLSNNNECIILGTVSSTNLIEVCQTIETINNYFGRGKLLVGKPSKTAPAFTANNHWNDSIVSKFGPRYNLSKEFPSAVEVYRRILASSADNSVTIITVGFLSNLADLLNSGPDQFSFFDGRELVSKKVEKLVCMAGKFPTGKEFNVFKDSTSAKDVFDNWPTNILFSGFEIGIKIMTGNKTSKYNVLENPVAWGYKYNLETYDNSIVENRPSWDQTAVLIGVRDPEDYFYINGPGTFIVNERGENTWIHNSEGRHHFISHKFPFHYIEQEIENLMINPSVYMDNVHE